MKFPIKNIRFQPAESWPERDLTHSMVMKALHDVKLPLSIPKRWLWDNTDGTMSPTCRHHEWQIMAAKIAGYKTINLTEY